MTDNVNHPSHHTDGNIEVIDFIEDKKLGFHLGNAVKYIARAGKKDPSKELEDLQKARWYLDRKIGELDGERYGKFKCTVCGLIFDNRFSFDRHLPYETCPGRIQK